MPSIFRILGRALFRGDATGSGNAVEIADSSGTNRVVVANTGRVTVSQDTTVTTETCAVITTDTTNANLIIAPNGTGAIIADIPDGASTGGNARGDNAVDLQMIRSAAADVASGNTSVLIGSYSRASGENSICIGANNSTTTYGSVVVGSFGSAIQDYATVIGGFRTLAYLYGQQANASGRFVSNSDAQSSKIIFRRSITGTAQTELFLDGASIRAILDITNGPTNARAWRAQIDVVAICATAGGTTVVDDVFSGSYQCTIKRKLATTSLVGTVKVVDEVSDTSMSTSVTTITADDTNEALRIQFTPPTTAGSTTVVRVVATAYLTEVGR